MQARFRAILLAVSVLALLQPLFAALDPASAQRYIQDVRVLSSPAMQGRGAGSKGLQRAEHYIRHEFQTLGLQPAGQRGYLQPFTVSTGARLRPKNHLIADVAGSQKLLKLGEDYIPLSFSAVGAVSGPVVFAGYGASADEFQYDDYAHLDVKDKIVLVLRYEPAGFAEKNGQQGQTIHAHLITKAISARNHGARAVILVNGKLPSGEDDALIRFGSVAGPENSGIPIVQVKNAVVDGWLKAAGKSLAELQQGIDGGFKPHSFPLPDSIKLSLRVDIQTTHATVDNVLGFLPGKSDEYIVIGAHYDHLGRGDSNSLAPSQIGQIHPGADDNASGAAGVLELARLFSRQRGRLQRGILFAAFAGEELGLLGSAHWVKQPTLPLDKAVAMLNMDMIGRIRDSKVFIGGVGTASDFKPMIEHVNSRYGFHLSYSAGGYSASDHTSFVTKRVPVLFFFSGLHSDYHKPSDTWDKIQPDSAARLLAMIADVASTLVSEPQRPLFVRVEPERQPGEPSAGRGYGPYFGSIPDFGQEEGGVKFADVHPGSPADKAGLKQGDVLVQFGDRPINNLYDFTDALRRSKVGDVVAVKVLRDGKPLAASVTLEQRR